MTDETMPILREGEARFRDLDALFERLGGLYVYRVEGGATFMGIPGKGEVLVDSLLVSEGRLEAQNGDDNVTTLRRAD